MKNSCCLAVIFALVSLIAGCNSKNEPDEKSLGRLINAALEQKTRCIYLGQMPYKMTDSGPPTGYDALTRVGLLERSQVSQSKSFTATAKSCVMRRWNWSRSNASARLPKPWGR
jgi:hypothetical protein